MTMIEVFSKDAHHRFFKNSNRTEIKQLEQQITLILLFEYRQLSDATFSFTFLLDDIAIYTLIVDRRVYDNDLVQRTPDLEQNSDWHR